MLQKEPGIAFWLVASSIPPRALRTQGLLFPFTKRICEEGLLSIRRSELECKKQRLWPGPMSGTLYSVLCTIFGPVSDRL